jgi:hypothetical protein
MLSIDPDEGEDDDLPPPRKEKADPNTSTQEPKSDGAGMLLCSLISSDCHLFNHLLNGEENTVDYLNVNA